MIILNSENQLIALGGLLHDIGKLLNRCDSYMNTRILDNKKHPELSLDFIKDLNDFKIIEENPTLNELVQKHHESQYFDPCHKVQSIKDLEIKKLATIVARADNYSSFERKDEEGSGYFKTKPLTSLFKDISLNIKKKSNNDNKQKSYKLNNNDYKNIFPYDYEKNSQNELKELVNNFLKEVKLLNNTDFNTFFVSLNSLLKKYTWCIPSDTQTKISDISIYNHLKTTSALALASYQYNKESNKFNLKDIEDNSENRFLIIGGKLQGEDKYRYNITTSKQSTKRLRGRGIKVELLKRSIVLELLNELNLTICNYVLDEGGIFYIIAPNLDSVRTAIKQCLIKINSELLNKYNGELLLNIKEMEANGTKLKDFNKILLNIENNLEIEGNKIVNELLIQNPIINKEIKGVCEVCNTNFITNDNICNWCDDDINIGKWIINSKNIAFYKGEEEFSNSIETLLGYKVAFLSENDQLENKDVKIMYNLYGIELKNKIPVDYWNIASYEPVNKDTGEVKNFKELAALSQGVKNLGILTLNIDNKDFILYNGFKEIINKNNSNEEKVKDYASISRIYTFCDFLNRFFNDYVPSLFRDTKSYKYELKSKGVVDRVIEVDLQNIYILKSSESNIILIGPWANMIYVAKILRDKFSEFVCSNEDITLSGSLKVVSSTTPINLMINEITELKNIDYDGIDFFDYFIKWDDFDDTLYDCEYISHNIKNNIYSQSFMYRLLKYNNMAEEYFKNNDISKLQYISKFQYDLSRNLHPIIEEKYNLNAKSSLDLEKLKSMKEIKILNEMFSMTADTITNVDYKRNKLILNYVVRKNRKEI